jgi:hypothetical protein
MTAPEPDDLVKCTCPKDYDSQGDHHPDCKLEPDDLALRLLPPNGCHMCCEVRKEAAARIVALEEEVARLTTDQGAAAYIMEWLVAEKYNKPTPPEWMESARKHYLYSIARADKAEAERDALEVELVKLGRDYEIARDAHDLRTQQLQRAEAERDALEAENKQLLDFDRKSEMEAISSAEKAEAERDAAIKDADAVMVVLDRFIRYTSCIVEAFNGGRPALDMTLLPTLIQQGKDAIDAARAKGRT